MGAIALPLAVCSSVTLYMISTRFTSPMSTLHSATLAIELLRVLVSSLNSHLSNLDVALRRIPGYYVERAKVPALLFGSMNTTALTKGLGGSPSLTSPEYSSPGMMVEMT